MDVVYKGSGGPDAPCIFVVGAAGQPIAGEVLRGRFCSVAPFEVDSWDDDLTPWPAPGLYPGDAPFAGHAGQTLLRLRAEAMPAVQRALGAVPRAWAVMGYSLGGLFALYAFAQDPTFAAAASASGSVWYDGWVPYLQKQQLPGTGRFVYLSIGSAEKRAPQRRLHSVQERTEQTARILEAKGVRTVYRVGPGNHFQHVGQRMADAAAALDGFLAQSCGEAARV